MHQRLWPALVAVGAARASWQLRGLSDDGAALLAAIGRRRTPTATRALMPEADAKQRQRVVRELEQRLLIHTDEVHTESGAHAKYAQTWRTFARANRIDDRLPTPSVAKAAFEAVNGPLREFMARSAQRSGGYRVLKGMMAAAGRPVGPPRPPTLPLDADEIAEVGGLMRQFGWPTAS